VQGTVLAPVLGAHVPISHAERAAEAAPAPRQNMWWIPSDQTRIAQKESQLKV